MSDAQTHFTMFGVVLLTSTFIALAGARIYERCELARDLLKLGVNRDHVATWVCIAFHESRFDTAARNPHSGDHGLLQISELYWCGPGKACGAPCSAFRNDDISDDVKCALRIYNEHTRLQGDGFLAWVVYPHHCKHNAKKYLVDCDASVKNTQTKFNDRARYLKSFERNVTVPQYVNYPDIDRLKPNYLAVSELFKGSYDSQFEQNYYNNKAPVNWVNFKINNIDKLKLPDLNKRGNFEFTTASTTTTTTTLDPSLIGIKPPSPRRIESNQFRRRMMNSISIPSKDDNNDDEPRKLSTEISSSKTFTEIDLSQNPFINLQKLASKTSTEMTFRTRGLSTYTSTSINSFTSTTPRTKINSILLDDDKNEYVPRKSFSEVSSSSKTYTEIDLSQNPFINLHKLASKTSTEIPLRTKDFSSYSPSYINSFTLTTPRTFTSTARSTSSKETVLTEKQTHNSYTTTPNSIISRRGKSRYVPDSGSYYIKTQRPSPSPTPSVADSITTVKTSVTNDPKVLISTFKENDQRKYDFPDTTSQLSNIMTSNNSKNSMETVQVILAPLAGSSSDITQKYETTPKPPATTAATTRSPRFNWNNTRNIQVTTSQPQTISTTRPFSTSTTTRRASTSTTVFRSIPTTNAQTSISVTPAATTQKIFPSTKVTPVTQNVTEPAPTMKTTWSIFNLYLNPTKATIRPFKFTPFQNGSNKLSIFSGGTTTPPSSYLAKKKN